MEEVEDGCFAGLQRSEGPFEECLRQRHMLLNIRLQMPRACLPIVRCVADTAGEGEKLAGKGWWLFANSC